MLLHGIALKLSWAHQITWGCLLEGRIYVPVGLEDVCVTQKITEKKSNIKLNLKELLGIVHTPFSK